MNEKQTERIQAVDRILQQRTLVSVSFKSKKHWGNNMLKNQIKLNNDFNWKRIARYASHFILMAGGVAMGCAIALLWR